MPLFIGVGCLYWEWRCLFDTTFIRILPSFISKAKRRDERGRRKQQQKTEQVQLAMNSHISHFTILKFTQIQSKGNDLKINLKAQCGTHCKTVSFTWKKNAVCLEQLWFAQMPSILQLPNGKRLLLAENHTFTYSKNELNEFDSFISIFFFRLLHKKIVLVQEVTMQQLYVVQSYKVNFCFCLSNWNWFSKKSTFFWMHKFQFYIELAVFDSKLFLCFTFVRCVHE